MFTAPAIVLPQADVELDNYMSLIVLTAVGYDYILTFSNEVEYIWNRRWTLMTLLFILVRYVGLLGIVFLTMMRTTFLPATAKVCVIGTNMNSCAFLIFLGAADVTMILRLWAMYGRSKQILYTLLVCLLVEIISTTLAIAMTSANTSAITLHIADLSYCMLKIDVSLIWTGVAIGFRVTLGVVMCLLAVGQFLRQSLQMYHATKQWQPNRYMNLLVKQGIAYFLAIFLYNIVNILFFLDKIPDGGWQLTLLFILELVPLYTLAPRFIISTRKMYVHGSVQVSSKNGPDTGFGLSFWPTYGYTNVAVPISFAGIVRSDSVDSENSEDIPMEITKNMKKSRAYQ